MKRIPGLDHATLRTRLVWLAAIAVCCLAVALFLSHRDEARRLWEGLLRIPRSTVLLALMFIMGQVLCQALRFWAIIPRWAHIRFGMATRAYTLGECANMITPGRAGDVMKAVLVNQSGKGTESTFSRAAGAVLADKVIDVGTLVLVCIATGALGVLTAGVQAALPGPGVLLAAAVVFSVGVGATWLARPAWFTKLRTTAAEVAQGLSALKSPRPLLLSVAFSLGAWVTELIALKLLCAGMGFSTPISALMVAVVVLNAGVLVPISVANVGVYEAALAFGLTRVGIPFTPALAIAIAHHALELLALGLTTIILMLVARISPPPLMLEVPQ